MIDGLTDKRNAAMASLDAARRVHNECQARLDVAQARLDAAKAMAAADAAEAMLDAPTMGEIK